jgi:hypothetical protein
VPRLGGAPDVIKKGAGSGGAIGLACILGRPGNMHTGPDPARENNSRP